MTQPDHGPAPSDDAAAPEDPQTIAPSSPGVADVTSATHAPDDSDEASIERSDNEIAWQAADAGHSATD